MQGVEEEKEESEEGRRGPGVMLITFKAREGIGHLRRYRRERRRKEDRRMTMTNPAQQARC